MSPGHETKLVKSPDETRELSLGAKREGKVVGLVPTWGIAVGLLEPL